jgi:hypothetical protein
MDLELDIQEAQGVLGSPIAPDVYKAMTKSLHGFARGLCRLFTLGPLAEHSRHLTEAISPFLFSVTKTWTHQRCPSIAAN